MTKTIPDLDWSYHRNGCKTCSKTQDFLLKHKLGPAKAVIDARKERIDVKGALQLAHSAEKIYATKGSKVIFFDMKKDKPDDKTLASVLIGPSGNLRAPTLRIGKTLLVGFDKELYTQILCS
jgi:arsenate reductase-like glutaredoxin family protein